MARALRRGDIWMYRFKPPDKRRPVVILSRQEVIGLIRTVMVAPITSRVLGIPSEVVVGQAHGLKDVSTINLDHVQTVEAANLTRFVGHLDDEHMAEVCNALAIAAGCA
jgi:mRNA interferase MazF